MNTFLASLVTGWVQIVTRKPLVTLTAVLMCALASGVFAAGTLRLQGDVTELVESDASFLQNYNAYKAAFPQHRRLNVIVIDGADARLARTAMETLRDAMVQRPEIFPQVYAPGADPFLREHALLLLDREKLRPIVDRLAEAQPALATLARDPSLRGLADLFARADAEGSNSDALAELAARIAATARQVSQGEGEPLSWGELILGDAAPTRQLIVFQGSLGEDDGEVARRQAATIQELIAAERLTPDNGVTVRMTGRGPLSSAELESAVSSIQTVGLISLTFVALLLWLGLGSIRAIVAAIATLLVGLTFTAGFAALAVGSLNVLSLTFAVLFIGLGIDFAIHIILRRVGEGGATNPVARPVAWPSVTRGLGPTIALCGLTTAIAFLSFWPTAFRGLAELGLISAAGMIIAVFVSFTVLPPLLDLMRVQPRGAGFAGVFGGLGGAWLAERVGGLARPISVLSLMVLIAAAVLGSQVRFDFNSLNLQDRDSEAVQTLVSLHDDGTITPYTLTISAEDAAHAEAVARALRDIPSVGAVKTLNDAIPDDQDDRLAILDEAQILLGPAVMLGRRLPPPDAAERRAALDRLVLLGRERAATGPGEGFREMSEALMRLAGGPDTSSRTERFEDLVAGDFLDVLDLLRTALTASRIAPDGLPESLVARETGTQGQVRVVALPRDDLRDYAALGTFVDAVQAVFPNATGRPALEAGVGRIVVDAFRQAFATAAVAIFLVLVLALRSFTDATLVMIPLLLAAALTAAMMVLLAIPLNVANVIVLPLLLGMGVDNGLHVVGRYRETGSVADVYRSSTPRAVVVSVLTTLLSFVALAFAEHRGMASMGQLLAIAIALILFATLVVLPALLAWRTGYRVKS